MKIVREWAVSIDGDTGPCKRSYPVSSDDSRVIAVETRYESAIVPGGRYLKQELQAYPVLIILDDGPAGWGVESHTMQKEVQAYPCPTGPNATRVSDSAGRYLGSSLDRCGRRILFFEPLEEQLPPVQTETQQSAERRHQQSPRQTARGHQPDAPTPKKRVDESSGTSAQQQRETGSHVEPFDIM